MNSNRIKSNSLAVVLALTTAIACCAPREVKAAPTVFLIDAANRGWINQDGFDNGTDATNNYVVGNCGMGNCNGEYRIWFQFSVPALPKPIESARLILDTVLVKAAQGPLMTLSMTSLPATFGFSDLGTGVVYGSRDYSATETNTTQFISLNSAALADIAASELGTFGTSGRITAGASFGPTLPDQLAFGFSLEFLTRLEITVVPEPNTLAIMSLGLLGIARRRQT